MDMIIAIVVLIVFGSIYGVLRLLIKSVKAISNLPIIAGIDKILGMILGVLLIIAIFQLVERASVMGFLGKYGNYIVDDVQSDGWLNWIVKHNLVEMFNAWKSGMLEKIS